MHFHYLAQYDNRIGESPWRSWCYLICIITHGLCFYNTRLLNDNGKAIGVSYWWKREFTNHARLHRGRISTIYIPCICYERSFSEFYLSIWNQLIFNGFSCLGSHCSHIYWFLPEKTKCVFPTYWLKKQWISEFHRTNPRNWNVDQLSVLITSWDATSTNCEKI